MTTPADLNRPIIEGLYAEAILLADEVRVSFEQGNHDHARGREESPAQIAISCEGLRTATRMMHVIAWLLNQRAYFQGNISEFQLRRHGRLPTGTRGSDPAQTALLSANLRELVAATERFYARIARLEQAWHARFAMQPSAIHRLHDRLGLALHYQ